MPSRPFPFFQRSFFTQTHCTKSITNMQHKPKKFIQKEAFFRAASSPSQSPSVTDSPFCRYATSSPGAGEVFPQGERPWQRNEVCVGCQGLSLWERWHRVSDDGEGEDAKVKISAIKVPIFHYTKRDCRSKRLFPRGVVAGNGICSTNFFAIKAKTPECLSAFRCLLKSNYFACGWVASLRRALSRIFSSVCSLRMCSALQASSAAVCSSTPSCTKKWVSSWWRL